MAAWSAIFLVDMWTRGAREGYDEVALYRPEGRYGSTNWAAIVSYAAGLFVGLGTVTSFSVIFTWAGYLLRWFGWDHGALANAPIGVFIAFLVSGILYAGLSRALRAGRRAGIAPTEAIAR